MVSAIMRADEIGVRVRAADTNSILIAPRKIYVKRGPGETTIDGCRIRFDLPEGLKKTAYLSKGQPSNSAPGPSISLHRRGIVGVVADWQWFGDGDVKLLIQFYVGDSVQRSREVQVESGRPSWFAPPGNTDGLGLVFVFEGSGEIHIEHLEVLTPPPKGWMPRGRVLINSLELAWFPQGPTSWIEEPESEVVDSGRVRIGGHELYLVPPIDWKIGPPRDRTFQLALHGFSFVDAVLAWEETDGAVWMADVFEDWMRAHPSHPHSTTEMAWNDMAVASRTLGILRVVDRLKSIDPVRAASLPGVAAEHAHWLAHDRNYTPAHDHGLFSDTALEYAARALIPHTLAERWRKRAQERIAGTLESVVCEAEGSVLEHSPAYIEKVAGLIDHRRRNGLRDNLVPNLLDRFEQTLSVLTTPNGRLLPLGDTGHDHLSGRNRPKGVFSFTRTGWGISHIEEQTVALCAGYHSSAHKHGDDLSVVFYDAEGPILTEAGFPGYGYRDDEFRSYGTSEQAHNAVVINDEIAEWRKGEPYGSAILQGTGTLNWHLLGGWNPLHEAGHHMRFVLHGSGVIVIADLLTGSDIQTVQRLIHLDDRLTLRKVSDTCVEFEDWSVTNWAEARSTEMSLMPKGAETRHFPGSEPEGNHHVLSLRDGGPGLRITTIARREARIVIDKGVVSGSDQKIRIELKTTANDLLSWALIEPWSDGGRLELEAVEI